MRQIWESPYGHARFSPVYRTYLADGRVFDYYTSAWQTGKRPEDSTAWWMVTDPSLPEESTIFDDRTFLDEHVKIIPVRI